MQIVFVGTGYVGLVTGACFAEMGHKVWCIDIAEEKIRSLQRGEIPIYEPGLEELVRRNTAQKRLQFTTSYREGLAGAEVCFLAVPTPSKEDGACDVSYVEAAARAVAREMLGALIVVNKSTVPVGTAFRVKEIMREELQARGADLSFDVVSNPEFLKEGAAVQDCLKPDRVVIGTDRAETAQKMKEIYAPFTLSHDRVLVMDVLSAEMTKYAANAMLATRISFMNEMAAICKEVGADVNQVRKGIGLDPRIGPSFLYAGAGYGGSCFPKDIRALIATARSRGVNPRLLEAVDQVNEEQKRWLIRKMGAYFAPAGGVRGKTFAVWGLSFKPDTDDVREAPALILVQDLVAAGAQVRLFDPVATPNAQKALAGVEGIAWCRDEFEAAQGADGIVLVTEWKQFRHIDFSQVKPRMKGVAFFDGRNQYPPLEMKKRGFDYMAIGVPDALQKGSERSR
jgi:UDPglucose 6-dehydrogenase